MYHLIFPMMASLRAYLFETHWYLLMEKFLDLMKALYWDYVLVKCLEPYLNIYMESHLVFMLEQILYL